MLPYPIPIILILLASCTNLPNNKIKPTSTTQLPSNDPKYVWTKIADSADWKKSYNFQLFSIGDSF
ncbi:MAG: hypothetical protein IPI45_03055 [Saprospiraceae bacterium]|nr:hypothetical protein [Saprospiraceae bacterium]MBK7736736.1 hypothetical protein [Saprospiraceae bacterium]MBK7911901.1 hypothetical protein [Saprospiraceae bacterium]